MASTSRIYKTTFSKIQQEIGLGLWFWNQTATARRFDFFWQVEFWRRPQISCWEISEFVWTSAKRRQTLKNSARGFGAVIKFHVWHENCEPVPDQVRVKNGGRFSGLIKTRSLFALIGIRGWEHGILFFGGVSWAEAHFGPFFRILGFLVQSGKWHFLKNVAPFFGGLGLSENRECRMVFTSRIFGLRSSAKIAKIGDFCGTSLAWAFFGSFWTKTDQFKIILNFIFGPKWGWPVVLRPKMDLF